MSRKLFALNKKQKKAFKKMIEAIDECMNTGIMLVNRCGTIHAFNVNDVDDFNLTNGDKSIVADYSALSEVPQFHRSDLQERLKSGYYIHLSDKGWNKFCKEQSR